MVSDRSELQPAAVPRWLWRLLLTLLLIACAVGAGVTGSYACVLGGVVLLVYSDPRGSVTQQATVLTSLIRSLGRPVVSALRPTTQLEESSDDQSLPG